MNNLTLTCKDTGDFKPHPEGIHPAVCVDVMDLGLVETDFQGQRKLVNKVKLTFESEAKSDDGKACTVSKNFTASLHPKAKLAEFLGKWRGRPVAPGESIDLQKLIGANCTLVISHQQNLSGKTYAALTIRRLRVSVTPIGKPNSRRGLHPKRLRRKQRLRLPSKVRRRPVHRPLNRNTTPKSASKPIPVSLRSAEGAGESCDIIP